MTEPDQAADTLVRVAGRDYRVRRGPHGAVSVLIDDVWCAQELLRANDDESLQMVVEILVQHFAPKVRSEKLGRIQRRSEA